MVRRIPGVFYGERFLKALKSVRETLLKDAPSTQPIYMGDVLLKATELAHLRQLLVSDPNKNNNNNKEDKTQQKVVLDYKA